MQTPSPRIPAKTQSAMIDVAAWEKDPEHATFPQGARDKSVVLSPDDCQRDILLAHKRYMFKLSNIRPPYPEQFWCEVIAYRVGCLMGLPVPHTFAAINSKTGQCGALSEWFYDVGQQVYTQAGDVLEQVYPLFDRKKGEMHNLFDIADYLSKLTPSHTFGLSTNWQQWWFDALLFDALIGNTDRHQDNWGFIISIAQNKIADITLTPLFDNGTSLGHERDINRVRDWSNEHIQTYLQKGKHHVKWSLQETPPVNGHFELIRKAAAAWPQVLATSRNRLNFSADELCGCFEDLLHLNCPVPLTGDRIRFIQRLLCARLSHLINTLDDCLGVKPSL